LLAPGQALLSGEERKPFGNPVLVNAAKVGTLLQPFLSRTVDNARYVPSFFLRPIFISLKSKRALFPSYPQKTQVFRLFGARYQQLMHISKVPKPRFIDARPQKAQKKSTDSFHGGIISLFVTL